MSIVGVIALSILILIGISGIIFGIYLIIKFQDGEGVFAITYSVAILFLSAMLIVCIRNDNTETTDLLREINTLR